MFQLKLVRDREFEFFLRREAELLTYLYMF